MSVFIALIHYPVLDKNKNVVATSVTNFDIHDISRVARTYGVKKFYIVTPIDAQKWFVDRIIHFWKHGTGASYNKTRNEALSRCFILKDIEEVAQDITDQTGRTALFVSTSAKKLPNVVSFKTLRDEIATDENDYCIIFGTGWGLHSQLLEEMDILLEPIEGVGDYNHLSVRCAVAIIMDRLLGRR